MNARVLASFFALSLVASGCFAAPGTDGDADTATASQAASPPDCSGLDQVSPGHPAVFFPPFDDAEQKALCMLDTAQHEVVIGHYNIRSQRMLDKLVELENRGVSVSVAVDQDNAEESYNTGDDFLEANGIPVVRHKPAIGQYSIMHLKTTVIDQEVVMTGSFNWNNTAAHANDENMLVFRDEGLAKKYRDEVLEVLGQKARTKDGGQVSAGVALHFSPEERLDYVIKAELDAATKSIDIAMFTFTLYNVSDALQKAVQRGVKVRMVVEAKQADSSDAEDKVESAGGKVIRGANEIGTHSAMHQKYAVIDGHKVITGATNWTVSGTRYNEEDLLIIDSAELALKYRKNFADLLWNYAQQDVTPQSPELAEASPAVFFHVVHDATAWGDRTVVVGNHPALGSWDPTHGIDTYTSDLYPSWSGRASLSPGDRIEYKFVTIKPWGEVQWEPGDNRSLQLPASGRSVVIEGRYGDTHENWTPSTH